MDGATDRRLSEASRKRSLTLERPWRQGFAISVLGDTYFGEFYQARRERRGQGNVLREHGYLWSLERLRGFLAAGDVNIANLEAALTAAEKSPHAGKKDWILKGRPGETCAALAASPVHVVTLGNNHVLDYGPSGLADTVEALNQHGLTWIGAGFRSDEALQPLTIEVVGHPRGRVRIAVVSAYHFNETYASSFRFYATDERPGVASLDDAVTLIRRLRSDHDMIVAVPHWGQNYRWRSERQARQARLLLEAGADLVLGHGAHMLQEVQRIGGRWVVYGLGNLVFNSLGEYRRRRVPPFSLMAKLTITSGDGSVGALLSLYPIVSDNQMTNYQPRTATTEEAQFLLTLLQERNHGPADLRIFEDEIGPHFRLHAR